MTDSNHRLQTQFDAFQELHPVGDSAKRKQQVRDLEAEVRCGRIHVSSDQLQKYRVIEKELARILAYLLIENGKVNSDPAMWRANIVSEWELLRRHDFSHDVSRMPLYYAVRTYVTRLKAEPDLKAAAQGDVKLISEIESRLAKSEIDRSSQLHDRVGELLSLLKANEPEPSPSSPTVAAARISRRGAITAAVIAAVATILGAVLANLNKIGSWFAPKADHTLAPKK